MDTSLDGNAAAGALGDLFTFDVTTAVSTCAACRDGRRILSCTPTWTLPGWCCAAHRAVPRSSASSARVTVPGWTSEASRSSRSTPLPGEGAAHVHAGHAGQPGGQLSNRVVEAVGVAAAERRDQFGVGMIRGERRGICNNHLGRLSSW
jgi:hypothetical protein